jgi:phosphoglycerate dehydrogenase-like enzyme
MTWRILATARAFWDNGGDSERRLVAAGCEIVRSPRPGPMNEEEMIDLLQGCDASLAASDTYNARVFAACPRLKVVARLGVGLDSVDVPAATQAGVLVTSTPTAMSEAVADYTFALLLGIARRIPEGDLMMRSGGWGELPGTLVYGKTIGLIGLGQIGRGVLRRAGGFSMRILVYDPPLHVAVTTGQASALPEGAEFTDLETLLRESDFVSVHAPKLPETLGLINAERLAMMKPSAFLINTARGALIDDNALIAALEAGKIAGIATDVFTQEPLPADHPLRKAPRTLLTPHNAFNAREAAMEMCRQSSESILAVIRGERPPGMVNGEMWGSSKLRLHAER